MSLRRTCYRVAALLVVSLLGWGCGGTEPQTSEAPPTAAGESSPRTGAGDRPDVVLVTIDTFRPDRLGTLGGERTTAPFLEELMARSVIFERAFSTSSWTAPSTSSLLTGTYPVNHGVIEGFMAHRNRRDHEKSLEASVTLNRLPDELPTLAEILRQEGYRTFGASSNINIGPAIGFDRGFDHFEQFGDLVPAEELADRLVAWSHESDWNAGPRFVYLHFNDVHGPYEEREPWFVPSDDPMENTLSAYDSQISYLDGVLADLYRRFDWDRNTVFAIVSDHGEELGERGRVGHFFSLHQELMRVLMVVSAPDLGVVGGRRLEHNTSLIDVVPTLLDLLGIQARELDGMSLAPWLLDQVEREDQARLRRRTLFGHRQLWDVRQGGRTPKHLWAAVRGNWKLIDHPAGPEKYRPKLYDHAADAGEAEDLVPLIHRSRRAGLDAHGEEVLDALRKVLESFRSGGFHQGERREITLDAEALEKLEALGYVQ